MIKAKIVSGLGEEIFARVNNEGALHVLNHPHPPIEESITVAPFRQYFTDNGLSTGSNDMRVNGSSTNQNFYISALEEKDLYINTCSVLISDAGATLNEFANLSALSNGVKLEWITNDLGTTEIHDGIKTNYEFMRLSGGTPSIGGASDAFRANNVSGSNEGYIPTIFFDKIFGIQWGLRLRKGTEDRIQWTIRDNLSVGIDEFNIIGLGIKI